MKSWFRGWISLGSTIWAN